MGTGTKTLVEILVAGLSLVNIFLFIISLNPLPWLNRNTLQWSIIAVDTDDQKLKTKQSKRLMGIGWKDKGVQSPPGRRWYNLNIKKSKDYSWLKYT